MSFSIATRCAGGMDMLKVEDASPSPEQTPHFNYQSLLLIFNVMKLILLSSPCSFLSVHLTVFFYIEMILLLAPYLHWPNAFFFYKVFQSLTIMSIFRIIFKQNCLFFDSVFSVLSAILYNFLINYLGQVFSLNSDILYTECTLIFAL